eukprot:1149026-Amphidinium_carterae.1
MTAEWVLGDPHGYISESDFHIELVYVDATRAASLAAVAVGVQRSLHDTAGASDIDIITSRSVNNVYRVLAYQPK